jgi:cyclopropane-fatty-acyl-phospholipid synthase
MLFVSLLKTVVQDGSFDLVDSRGKIHNIGDGSTPTCKVKLWRRKLDFSLILNPALTVPEAYMNGTLTMEEGTIYDFLDIAARNFRQLEKNFLYRLMRIFDFKNFRQYNPIKSACDNVAHHYDLSGNLYELFLDADRQYSCAYFPDEETDLARAQLLKKRHIASKLRLAPGQKILDIGSGWGGLALYLSKTEDVDVTGVTLSVEQYKISSQRAKEELLTDRVRFYLKDYRNEMAKYDRIVSVGMFEHVGKKNYKEFFENICERLSEDGVMVLHSIGRFNESHPINPFIRKYIFPGADLPALSEVTKAIEPTNLFITDIEILRSHYARTLRLWREEFVKNWKIVAEIYDQRFCRMWEVYLVLCEVGFRHLDLMVFQMQITKNINSLPPTRDYMLDWERQQAKREQIL